MTNLKLNLTEVQTADFRSSEVRHVTQYMKKHKLGPRDCVAFVSRGMDQIMFVRRPTVLEIGAGVPKRAYMSTKHRLVGGKWNIILFGQYAEEMGIDVSDFMAKLKVHLLEGIKQVRRAA